MMIERIFQVLAVVLMAVAIYFFWDDNKDYGFVSLVLSCCSFFLSYRFHLKEKHREREIQESSDRRVGEHEIAPDSNSRDDLGSRDA